MKMGVNVMSRADAIQDLYEEYYNELIKKSGIDTTVVVLEAMRLAQENYQEITNG